ncbi:MAG: diguanylate cyclase [Lachnospiraceae bacterium]|nr:diguanylate cyclase [Lachnospiraceae bacterium]
MNLVHVACDVMCIIFLFIILIGSLQKSEQRQTSTKMFSILVFFVLIGTVMDALSFYMSEYGGVHSGVLITNLSSYLLATVILLFFSYYMISVVRENVLVSYWALAQVVTIGIANFSLEIVGTINGQFIKVYGDKVVLGPWEMYTNVLGILGLLHLYFILFRHMKYIGYGRTFALGSYMLIPSFYLVLYVFFGIPDFTYVTITVAIEIIYSAIQAQIIMEGNLREKILNELSYVDSLTGLMNRRAFNRALENNSDGRLTGAVFCDLNALKRINDRYGHAAGDEYIKRFAKILCDIFGDGEVFRISGDEFVVFLYEADENEMKVRIGKLREEIEANNHIAAIGYEHGEATALTDLVSAAEIKMYQDKDRFYEKTRVARR